MRKRPWQDGDPTEADARFPSGRWAGWWRQEADLGRMQLNLTFGGGHIVGDGRDKVGDFMLSGRYDAASGRVSLQKTYLGGHALDYEGVAAAVGIRGTWHIAALHEMLSDSGPFHIWPAHSGDSDALREQQCASEPVTAE